MAVAAIAAVVRNLICNAQPKAGLKLGSTFDQNLRTNVAVPGFSYCDTITSCRRHHFTTVHLDLLRSFFSEFQIFYVHFHYFYPISHAPSFIARLQHLESTTDKPVVNPLTIHRKFKPVTNLSQLTQTRWSLFKLVYSRVCV